MDLYVCANCGTPIQQYSYSTLPVFVVYCHGCGARQTEWENTIKRVSVDLGAPKLATAGSEPPLDPR